MTPSIRICAYTCSPFLMLFLLAAFSHSAAGQAESDLFILEDERQAQIDARQSRLLEVVKRRQYVADVRLVRVENPTRLLHRQTLAPNVSPTNRGEALRTRLVQRAPDRFTWIGQMPDQAGHVLLVVDGVDVTGVIHIGHATYTVDPVGSGLHALARLDPSKLLPEEYDVAGRAEEQHEEERKYDQETHQPGGAKRMSVLSNTQIDVLLVYTPAAANASGNITSVVVGAIDAANDVLANSGIDATLSLVHQAQVSYMESGSHCTGASRLRSPSDGYMDNVHGLRDQYAADVVVLISNENDLFSYGCAAAIHVGASYAFASVQWDQAIGYYTLAHEIGHLIGGRHHNDQSGIPLPYAHGYVYEAANWRTVMATVSGTTIRLPYWSDPTRNYGGVPMGTVSWNDNVRVWTERAATVAAFRTIEPLTASITGPTLLGWKQQGTWTANASGGSGPYSYEWRYRLNGTGAWSGVDGTSQTYIRTMANVDIELQVRVASGTETVYDTHYVRYNDQAKAVSFALEEAYPNPFNPQTAIRFTVPSASHVRLGIYDVIGREVARLVDQEVEAGSHQVTFQAGALPAGLYLARIDAGSFRQTQRLMLVK